MIPVWFAHLPSISHNLTPSCFSFTVEDLSLPPSCPPHVLDFSPVFHLLDLQHPFTHLFLVSKLSAHCVNPFVSPARSSDSLCSLWTFHYCTATPCLHVEPEWSWMNTNLIESSGFNNSMSLWTEKWPISSCHRLLCVQILLEIISRCCILNHFQFVMKTWNPT